MRDVWSRRSGRAARRIERKLWCRREQRFEHASTRSSGNGVAVVDRCAGRDVGQHGHSHAAADGHSGIVTAAAADAPNDSAAEPRHAVSGYEQFEQQRIVVERERRRRLRGPVALEPQSVGLFGAANAHLRHRERE